MNTVKSVRVHHTQYGNGYVRKSRYNGFELLVEFDSGIIRWFKKRDLRFIEKPSTGTKPTAPAIQKTLSDAFDCRKLIESLRFGIAPNQYCNKFTFGRDSEIKEIKRWLVDDKSGTLIIKGDYGSGKSHLLDYIHSYCLNARWAVARVEIDPSDAPFYQPKRIFQAILKSLRYIHNQEINYFENIFEIIKNRKEIKEDYKCYLGSLLRYSDYSDYWTGDVLVNLIINSAFNDYSSTANICCNIISSIGWSLKEIIGLKGLLILFDEAELINSSYYYYQLDKGTNLLKGLIFMSNNNTVLLKEDIARSYQNNGYFGNKTRLQYYGRGGVVRYLSKVPCNTKIIFAFAPSSLLYYPFLQEQKTIKIDEISKDHLSKITQYIYGQYVNAYKCNLPLPSLKKLSDEHTRRFIKGIIELLDIARHEKLNTIL